MNVDQEAGAGQPVARFVPSEDSNDPATQEFVACHRLASAELPAHRLRSLLEAVDGSPSAALQLSPTVYQSPSIGMTDKQVARLTDAKNTVIDSKLLQRALGSGTYALLYPDPAFPSNLFPLYDTPPLLFVRGNLVPEDRFAIGIVGTRRASNYGREQAARFAGAFAAEGMTIVSGGAAGIDAAAHTGALNAGGRTIAVLGCGVDIVYPAENRALFARILSEGRGAIVSEFPLGTKPEPWRFPTRNRIIAGLSRASMLIETPEKSGALGTASCAVEYGRDVYVVPGPVDTGRSRGGHRLLADGAIIADSPDDVLASLGVVIAAQEEPKPERRRAQAVEPVAPILPLIPVATSEVVPSPPVDLPPDQVSFLAALNTTPKPFDTIAQESGLAASAANVAATLLEMRGLIRRYPGNLFSRT